MTNDVFLTAEWRKLLMVNYVVDPSLVKKYLPAKTEIDLWNGHCYLSLVGFMFVNTRVKGCRIPFHDDFVEVNLRFYVRHKDGDIWRRGVVFIREFVPLPMVTVVANTLYQERYKTIPMKHSWNTEGDRLDVDYKWKRNSWHSISAVATNTLRQMEAGSEEEFITQHFWGYSRKPNYTSEYRVGHDMWKCYDLISYSVEVDFVACYGTEFSFLNRVTAHSVFLAEGSEITVYRDRRL